MTTIHLFRSQTGKPVRLGSPICALQEGTFSSAIEQSRVELIRLATVTVRTFAQIFHFSAFRIDDTIENYVLRVLRAMLFHRAFRQRSKNSEKGIFQSVTQIPTLSPQSTAAPPKPGLTLFRVVVFPFDR